MSPSFDDPAAGHPRSASSAGKDRRSRRREVTAGGEALLLSPRCLGSAGFEQRLAEPSPSLTDTDLMNGTDR